MFGIGREKGSFNPELSALPQNASEYQGNISSIPETKDEKLEIAAGIYSIIRGLEQGK
jgi:hypothetical protein